MRNSLIAALLLLVCSPAAHAGDFVTRVPPATLPGPKYDWIPIPVGADPNRYIRAMDYNAVVDALYDLRTALADATQRISVLESKHPLLAAANVLVSAGPVGTIGDGAVALSNVTVVGNGIILSGSGALHPASVTRPCVASYSRSGTSGGAYTTPVSLVCKSDGSQVTVNQFDDSGAAVPFASGQRVSVLVF